jgi:hypothetical protein
MRRGLVAMFVALALPLGAVAQGVQEKAGGAPPVPQEKPRDGYPGGPRDDYRDDRDGWREGPREGRRLWRGDPAVVDRKELMEKLAEINDTLADAVNRSKRDKQLLTILKALKSDLDEVRTDLTSAPDFRTAMEDWRGPDRSPPPGPPGPPGQRLPSPPPGTGHPGMAHPMSDASLGELMRAMSRESFPRDRLRVMEQAASVNWFVVGQVQQLLKQFEFPKDRLQAVRVLKPRILDTENYFKLYGSFEFPSDKAELKNILGL